MHGLRLSLWMVSLVLLPTALGAAGLFGLGGSDEGEDQGPGGFLEAMVVRATRYQELRDEVAWFTALPQPQGDPSKFSWPPTLAKQAARRLGVQGKLRRHRPGPAAPATLELPWPDTEGEPAADDPEIEMPRGMTYQNWTFGLDGMPEIACDLTFHRAPRGPAGVYLQVYDGAIGDTGQYFGFQYREVDGEVETNVIWSRFGTRDTDHLEEAPGGYHEAAGYEGDFLSVRYPYRFQEGTYTMHVRMDEATPRGVWYAMRIYDHQDGTWTDTGRLRFPWTEEGGVPYLRDGGGSWQEVFGGVTRPGAVSPFHLSLGGIYTLGRVVAPRAVRTAYGEGIDNSDVSLDLDSGRVHVRFGGSTRRRTPAGSLSFGPEKFVSPGHRRAPRRAGAARPAPPRS